MKTRVLLYVLLIFIFFQQSFVHAQSPTKWRGPFQNGFYPETGLLTEWPADGPEILWHFDELGEGYSSPAFANERIYISGMEGTMGYIYSLTMDGTLIWKAPYGEEFSRSYPGSRSTPVIMGDYLYMVSGLGKLTCLSSLSGKLIWTKHLYNDFDGRSIQWGHNETVLIYNDWVIATPGGRKNNIIALDHRDGSLIWSSSGLGEESTYCTPLYINLDDRNLLVTHTEKHILGLDADSGKLLWSHQHTNRYNIHPNTPIFYNNSVFCFSGYGKGGVMLELNDDGSRINKKWFAETMNSRTGGAVLVNGKIYGSGDTDREWQCIDWESGQVEYTTKEIGNGVVITAEGLLYLYSERGELALVRPAGDHFEIISETRVKLGNNQHWAHPVIHNGRLYVRHGDTLIAYDIKK